MEAIEFLSGLPDEIKEKVKHFLEMKAIDNKGGGQKTRGLRMRLCLIPEGDYGLSNLEWPVSDMSISLEQVAEVVGFSGDLHLEKEAIKTA